MSVEFLKSQHGLRNKKTFIVNFLKFIALSPKTTEKCPATSDENDLTTY